MNDTLAEEGVVHELKTWSDFFIDVISGRKSFEIRINDRDFKVGERLILREWLPEQKKYTGRWIEGPPFLPPKTCVLGIEPSHLNKPFVPAPTLKKPWPPLPDLTTLTREQLVDCCHRLQTSCVQMSNLLEENNERFKQLDARLKTAIDALATRLSERG